MHKIYSSKGRNLPTYSWAVNSLVVILLMHVFLFCFAFSLREYLPYGEKFFITSEFGIVLFIMIAYVLLVILVNVFFKEKDVLKIQMGEKEMRRGYFIIIIYLAILFGLVVFLPFYKK